MYKGEYAGHAVAIKEIKDMSEDNRNALDREVDMLKLVSGPNIVKFYGAVVTKDKVYHVSELMDLGGLDKVLRDKLDMGLKVKVLRDVAGGMASLHAKNILHRDLKPENVLCKAPLEAGNEGMCKITDFGTSRSVDNLFAMTMTKGAGTPLYMAPEILKGVEHYGGAVDVYSYGILMWSVFHDGAVPYAEYEFKNALVMQNAVVGGMQPQVTAEDIPEELLGLMKRCWAAEPEERPTFEEIVGILADV